MKLERYVIIGLVIGLIGMFLYFKNQISFLEQENSSVLEQQKEEARETISEAYKAVDSIISRDAIIMDSLEQVNRKVKYIRYEKYMYTDRSVDDAIHVISEYEYKP